MDLPAILEGMVIIFSDCQVFYPVAALREQPRQLPFMDQRELKLILKHHWISVNRGLIILWKSLSTAVECCLRTMGSVWNLHCLNIGLKALVTELRKKIARATWTWNDWSRMDLNRVHYTDGLNVEKVYRPQMARRSMDICRLLR